MTPDTPSRVSPSEPETILRAEVWQHPEHGVRYHAEGRCVTCGAAKERPEPYHCDDCYSRLVPTIFDYDDD